VQASSALELQFVSRRISKWNIGYGLSTAV
jgi:hypothetical protein